MGGVESPGAPEGEKTTTYKQRTAKERAGTVVEFASTDVGVSETCRKCGISPTASDNWRKMAMDAGKREPAGIGGNGRSDPAKAMSKEIESLKIVVGEQVPVNAELKKKPGAVERASAVKGEGEAWMSPNRALKYCGASRQAYCCRKGPSRGKSA